MSEQESAMHPRTMTKEQLQAELEARTEGEEQGNGTAPPGEDDLLLVLSSKTIQVKHSFVRISLADDDGEPITKRLPIQSVKAKEVNEAAASLSEKDKQSILNASTDVRFAESEDSSWIVTLVAAILGLGSSVKIEYQGSAVWGHNLRTHANIKKACLGLLQTFPNAQALNRLSLSILALSQMVQVDEDELLRNFS